MNKYRCILFATALSAATLSGCSNFVAGRIVDAPGAGTSFVDTDRAFREQVLGVVIDRTHTVTVEPGVALYAAVIEPAQRGFTTEWAADEAGLGPVADGRVERPVTFTMQLIDGGEPVGVSRTTFAALPADPAAARRGTIVLLHGFGLDGLQLLTWGIGFAEHGWRTVLVDLRGHGRSGGRHRTWGPQDGADLERLLDVLELDGPLVAFGVSYGGAAAVHWAARDPRVDAVVTLAAFANPAESILGGAQLVPFGAFIPSAAIARGIERAGATIGHDLADGQTPERVAAEVAVPWLIVHGADDRLVPPAQAARLQAAAPDADLRILAGLNHVTIALRQDVVDAVVECWLEDALSGQLDDARHDLDCVSGDADPVAVEGAP